jgi:type IV secretory pathway VirB10-like protein
MEDRDLNRPDPRPEPNQPPPQRRVDDPRVDDRRDVSRQETNPVWVILGVIGLVIILAGIFWIVTAERTDQVAETEEVAPFDEPVQPLPPAQDPFDQTPPQPQDPQPAEPDATDPEMPPPPGQDEPRPGPENGTNGQTQPVTAI